MLASAQGSSVVTIEDSIVRFPHEGDVTLWKKTQVFKKNKDIYIKFNLTFFFTDLFTREESRQENNEQKS
jgi:hypothetical protein